MKIFGLQAESLIGSYNFKMIPAFNLVIFWKNLIVGLTFIMKLNSLPTKLSTGNEDRFCLFGYNCYTYFRHFV